MSEFEELQDAQRERELAREFMRVVLEPEAPDSPNLKFVEAWKHEAEQFVINIQDNYDQDTLTAFLAIMVNASKALSDQAHENPISPVAGIADELFAGIREFALQYSPALREAVQEKRVQQKQSAENLTLPPLSAFSRDSSIGGNPLETRLTVLLSKEGG